VPSDSPSRRSGGTRSRAAASAGEGATAAPRRPATTRSHRPKATASDAATADVRVRRFDADRSDEVLSLDEALAERPTERQLLWVDVVGTVSADDARRLAERFELDARTRRSIEAPIERPHLALHGGYLHIRVAAEPDDREPHHAAWLDIVGGHNVVITHHDVPIGFLDEMDERIETDTTFGMLDSASFVASLLDAAVTSYFRTVDAIEDKVDRLDAVSLRDDGRQQLLDGLVTLRRRVARLRRLLTDHRQVFASLAGPDVAKLTNDPDSAPAFQAVAARFESAIAAVEDAREVLLGSFDVYMTRTAQRTNDVMKVLALATVLLLPGSLIAGLLGMNVSVPLPKDDPVSFWLVAGGVLMLAIVILVVARRRRWL
jgi:magnesium transporter